MTTMTYVPFAPPPGLTAAQEEELLKASFGSMVPGATAEAPEALRNAYEYAQAQVGHWQDQLALIRNQVRRHLGNAQTLTTHDVPWAQRRRYPRAAYAVPAGDVDAIYPTHKG